MTEPERPGRDRTSSPLAEALARVGDRWTLLVVQALLGGSRRFNDLLEQIPGIAPNILSERLKRLERDALLLSRPYTDRPPRTGGHGIPCPPRRRDTPRAARQSRPGGTARPVTTL